METYFGARIFILCDEKRISEVDLASVDGRRLYRLGLIR